MPGLGPRHLCNLAARLHPSQTSKSQRSVLSSAGDGSRKGAGPRLAPWRKLSCSSSGLRALCVAQSQLCVTEPVAAHGESVPGNRLEFTPSVNSPRRRQVK